MILIYKKKEPKCFLPIRYCSLARTLKILWCFVCLEWSKRHCQNIKLGLHFFVVAWFRDLYIHLFLNQNICHVAQNYLFWKGRKDTSSGNMYIYIFFFLFFEIVELLNAPRTCILSVIIKIGKFIYLTSLSLTFSLFYFKATTSLAFVMRMKLRSVFIIYLFVYEVEYGCLYFSC